MSSELAAAPVLSTPADDQIFEAAPAPESIPTSSLSDEALHGRYEIGRTADEIRLGGWRRIALQFPDDMLVDAPRVAQALDEQLGRCGGVVDGERRRIHILADTSYSACCVDEVAAEHADADVVVHYGRSCLSPTSRLPVVRVYTARELDHEAAAARFSDEFPDRDAKVVVMADLPYQEHVDGIVAALRAAGYAGMRATTVERNPGARIPNRRIEGEPDLTDDEAKSHAVFHVADPPTALLLALQTRFASLHVLRTTDPSAPTVDSPTVLAAGLLRRRFARVLSLAAAGVVGILVNTLSVSNYLASIDLLRDKIAAAGKKSYTVVVGKLNPAKLANFAEIEGWVVVGCWESGLVEDDAGYWRPVVTPFEMEVALLPEQERTWGAEWWGGIEKLRPQDEATQLSSGRLEHDDENNSNNNDDDDDDDDDGVDGPESLPPHFDLRTGRLVSHSRPLHLTVRSGKSATATAAAAASTNEKELDQPPLPGAAAAAAALTRRAPADLVQINGVASPGAEYLRSQRTWQGLGTDLDFDHEASTLVEEGRSGVARGYRVGGEDGDARH